MVRKGEKTGSLLPGSEMVLSKKRSFVRQPVDANPGPPQLRAEGRGWQHHEAA